MRPHIIVLLILLLAVATGTGQIAGRAGAYGRLGFGARGTGGGNALTAVTSGEISTYYNPALAAFSTERTAAATFGILAFDRYLNTLSYTQSIQNRAGISVGLINAGVRNIDGRDADGVRTEEYSTTENQFYLSFANRVDQRVSLGVTIKLLYGRIFEDVTSTTVGFDVGACILVTDNITLGVAVKDLNAKYKWDTKSIYGRDGKSTDDKFPTLTRVGAAYALPHASGYITAEYERSSASTDIIRIGAEYVPIEYFTVRSGVDRWNSGDEATGAKPSFGFTLRNAFSGWTPSLTYAFVAEPIASHGMHCLTLSTSF